MKRGDLVTIVSLGASSKPIPALVIQSDLFAQHPSVTVLPVTKELRETPLFRVAVTPSTDNGVRRPSQVRVDKAQSVPRQMIGEVFAHLDGKALLVVNRVLAVFLGFA